MKNAERTKLIEQLKKETDRLGTEELERVIAFVAGVSVGASCIKNAEPTKADTEEKTGDE